MPCMAWFNTVGTAYQQTGGSSGGQCSPYMAVAEGFTPADAGHEGRRYEKTNEVII